MNGIEKLMWGFAILGPLVVGCDRSGDMRDLQSRVETLEQRLQPGPTKLQRLFTAIDVDMDGNVTKDEFTEHMKRVFTVLAGRMDADGDGTINKDEFAISKSQETLDTLFALDVNQDQLVTEQEATQAGRLWFLGGLASLKTGSDVLISNEQVQDHFRQRLVDFCAKKNCEPVISLENYLKWYLPLFDAIDFNHDQKIVFSELRRHKRDTGARMLARQAKQRRGFELDHPGLLCTPDGMRCIGYKIPGPGGHGSSVPGDDCSVCDPDSEDFEDFVCYYMGEIVNCSD